MGNSREGKLIKNSSLYILSNFGSKILTFLIVPLYTYYLTTEQFGEYDTVISIISLICPIISICIFEGVLRWLLKSEENPNTIIKTGLSVYLIFLAISSILLAVIFWFFPFDYWYYFIILCAAITFFDMLQFICRGVKKNIVFAVSGVLYTVVLLGLNIILIVFLNLGIHGLYLSLIGANFVASIFILLNLKQYLFVKKQIFNWNLAKELILYSIMLVPNAVSWWIMNASDRIMITMLIGTSATGIYAIACKFPSIISTIHNLFYRAWQEQAIDEFDSKDRNAYYSKIFNQYLKIIGSIILILIPFTKLFIMWFMNYSYQEGYMYISILYIAAIFSSFSSFYGTGYLSAKNTKGIMLTTICGAVINITVNIILIPIIGIWGACVSTLISYCVTWAIRMIQTRKYFIISVNWKLLFLLLFLGALYGAVICFVGNLACFILLLVTICFTVYINFDVIKALISNLFKKDINQNEH